MDNLEQQLQQLRLIHNRITSNDANASGGNGSGVGQIATSIAPTYKPTSYGFGKKKHNNIVSNSGGCDNDKLLGSSGGGVRVAAARWDGMALNKRHDTLDNPIVLDQQLEALAHHKRQMEKRGLLQNQQQIHYNNKGVPQQQQQKDINSHKNTYEGLQATSLFGLNEDTLRQKSIVNDDGDDDDDNETSPPSPVSSSYSELRHAAESSTSKLKPLIQQQQLLQNQQQQQQQQQNMLSGSGTYMNVIAYGQNSCCSPATNASSINNQQDSTDYYDFGNFSQSSSTYESIYEPINPRPSSQMSNVSSLANNHHNNNHRHHSHNHNNNNNNNNMNMAPYANLMSNSSSTITLNNVTSSSSSLLQQQQNNSTTTTLLSSSSCSNYDDDDDDDDGNRECGYDTEDTLTDYMDRSSIDYNECENYGICCKCNDRVIGENSGCTAMEQIYHIECFTCTQCQINLQGKPFYAIDNKAYCEYDYLQTLEKCSVCTKPILERILRATGKPYHPQCFTCVVCGKSLDGIQFTVDATNQNYCITDFHKKFAPRCCVCKKPIMPESGEEETVRVVALDRSFHLKCYKCEDCGLLLSSNSEGRGCYPLDDHVLCKSCNAKRVQILTSSDL